jgi:hypothetical protein
MADGYFDRTHTAEAMSFLRHEASNWGRVSASP